jgi:hypothetical protein
VSDYDPRNDPDAPLDWLGTKEDWLRLGAGDGPGEGAGRDMSGNALHAGTGAVCSLCHRAIEAGQDVRLRVDGTYQHESCPL